MIFYQKLYELTGGRRLSVTSKRATGCRGRRLGKVG